MCFMTRSNVIAYKMSTFNYIINNDELISSTEHTDISKEMSYTITIDYNSDDNILDAVNKGIIKYRYTTVNIELRYNNIDYLIPCQVEEGKSNTSIISGFFFAEGKIKRCLIGILDGQIIKNITDIN